MYYRARLDVDGVKQRRHTLRKKSPYSELFWFAFFPHFPAFGLNTERSYLSVLSPIAGKCGKNGDPNNSEYGHFLCNGLVQTRHYNLQYFKVKQIEAPFADVLQNKCS